MCKGKGSSEKAESEWRGDAFFNFCKERKWDVEKIFVVQTVQKRPFNFVRFFTRKDLTAKKRYAKIITSNKGGNKNEIQCK